MADLPCQGSLSLNNSVTNSVSRSAGTLSLFPEGLTVQGETLSEEAQQSVLPHKSKTKNDSFVGSKIELSNFSLRLVDSDPKDEDTDKHSDTKIDNRELPKTRQKQMVTELSNLEEKRTLDIADSMCRNDISRVMPVRLFNFQSREISNEPQNSSSAINESEAQSANMLSMPPIAVQHSFSPYRNDKLTIFTGGVMENSKTECAFVPAANNLPVYRTQPISTRKPPLPPGATHLKGGFSHKTNKVHIQRMPQESRKHLRVSEFRTKNFIPAEGSDKEGCVERRNSCPLYRRTPITDKSRGLTVKSVMFDKVASAATNSSMDLVTISDNIQAPFPASSREGRILHQQDISAFSNDNMKKTLGSEGNVESDNKNSSSLDHKRKWFQRSQYNVTGKAHFQSFFEEEDKGIHEFTVGESLCSNVGAALQVTKGTLQNRSGLLPISSAPISHIQDPSRLLANSDDQMPRNIAKSSNQNFLHFKSSEADISWYGREFISPASSGTEKSGANFSLQQQQVNSPPVHSLQKFVEMQVQDSRTSSTVSYSCESIVEPYYNTQTEHCRQMGRAQINSKKRDFDSCTTDYLKAPVIISQAEMVKSLQIPSVSSIKQVHHNFNEGAEGYIRASKSSSTDVEVRKVDVERLQRQLDQVKDGVFKLGSPSEGTVHGVDLEVMQSLQDRDLGNSKTENLPPEKTNSSHHNLQPSIIETPVDTVIRSSPEFCMVNTRKRWRKRLKWTLDSDEKMQESTSSDMVLDTQGQKMQILDQCGGFSGNRNSELVSLHHTVDFTRASKEVLEHHRSTACEKDVPKQNCESPIPNEVDAMASCLHKHSHCIDHQVSSSFLDDNTVNRTTTGQNTMDPSSHSTNSIDLQTKVSSPGKGASSRLQKKIDVASILSHPWIQRWRPSCPIASSLWEMHHSSLVNKEINHGSLPQLFGPMKMMPSAAAMAIVGIAARQFQPCQLQKKGSFSVWTAVGFAMNGTVE
ncbi:hypothetical protein SUGI_0343330 [Cryptomeria japonica]|uniref:uncharacterized protein LOC131030844 n=1 Tax=Cryptomeria japonica TaxID=3369 RepID=UPI002408DB4C|nr:uncharacterized protein LOC131030844 [Cryptomeria japonica]XP_057817756.2 uncharacterized protein LOC131030844 [Cryptomeria japonica]XP_057817757.2 uncharacterized protein LOC131030844 [Cryptomeria japonica]GLJ19115.1 hypothetical protein SUGI_0343330 [Cryptomeria japonica]